MNVWRLSVSVRGSLHSDSSDLDSAHSDSGAQPLTSIDGKVILAVNGEIYNHLALRESLGPEVTFKTHSDCEVILPLVCLSWSCSFSTSLTPILVPKV